MSWFLCNVEFCTQILRCLRTLVTSTSIACYFPTPFFFHFCFIVFPLQQTFLPSRHNITVIYNLDVINYETLRVRRNNYDDQQETFILNTALFTGIPQQSSRQHQHTFNRSNSPQLPSFIATLTNRLQHEVYLSPSCDFSFLCVCATSQQTPATPPSCETPRSSRCCASR